MTGEEKRAGNILCQEYMGWKLESTPSEICGTMYQFTRYNESGEIIDEHWGGDSWNFKEGSTLPYDSNWNYLMSVVEKIEKTPGKTIRVAISGYICDIIQSKRDPSVKINGGFEDVVLVSKKHNDKKQLVFEAVVEFIKLHS